MTVRALRPMAKALGVKGQKIVRFTERTSHLLVKLANTDTKDIEGYAVFYFGLLGACGLVSTSQSYCWSVANRLSVCHARSSDLVYVSLRRLFEFYS